MSTDLQLDIWREEWQTEERQPKDSIRADLRQNVERQSRMMKIGIICDIIVTVVIGGGTTAWALLSKDSGSGLVAMAAWLFLAAAWTFVLKVNQGLWSPPAMDTATFVDLSVRRCQSALAAVWFAGLLFIAEIAFGLTWAFVHSGLHMPVRSWLLFGSARIDFVWACTALFFMGLVWFRRNKKLALQQLLTLRKEMLDSVDGPQAS